MSIQSVDNSKQNQTVTNTSKETTDRVASTVSSEFENVMLSFLKVDQAKEVSEEDLFAGLIRERIQSLKGDEAAGKYDAAFEMHKTATQRPDGKFCIEDSARAALVDLQNDGTLTKDESDTIHSQAFAGAQLDSNIDALYDSFGGPNDPTRAVMVAESALISAKKLIERYVSGEETPTLRPADETKSNVKGAVSGSTSTNQGLVGGDGEIFEPDGTTMDGQDGFLFKPVSSHDGKLAVIMSAALAPLVQSVHLVDADGNDLEQGNDMGIGEGARRNFRFSKSGGDYPENLYVEARLTDGTTRRFLIPDPSQRYD